ncbi:GNAT family N-acetyltransferase [Kineothrix sp. MB12-C1]|uniref:GNAT family N-acetyltransferase n=1 Tax=Kineothrix sp. MB12-C1 TaxID=3070215 RepID=UPI0027D26056|nr:GNAT family N-acetyltransferase [Kineothrix sp. MB12-C1]WMC93367.1 GNAT family N-acetyltransferase [Kineothrix sp. MB12-C1]
MDLKRLYNLCISNYKRWENRSPLTDEDKKYFLSDDYRSALDGLCDREVDRAQRIFFEENGRQFGFCMYCVYASEDGKCFILDYCIYPEYRGKGYGKTCFLQLKETVKEAEYYELNLSDEKNRRFWMSLGFTYNGYDAHGSILYTLMEEALGGIICEELKEEDNWQILNLWNGYQAHISGDFLSEEAGEALIQRIEQRQLHAFVAKRKTRAVGMYVIGSNEKVLFVEPLFQEKGIENEIVEFAEAKLTVNRG